MKKFNSRPNQNERRPYRRDDGRKPAFKRPFRNPADFHPSKVNNSVELLATFDKRTVTRRYGEDTEQLLRRFKRIVENSGVMSELKKREFHLTKGQKAREKMVKAKKRARKKDAIMQQFENNSR